MKIKSVENGTKPLKDVVEHGSFLLQWVSSVRPMLCRHPGSGMRSHITASAL